MTGEYDAGYENCIDSMVRQMEDMQFRIDSLHRENAKLRELVRDMAAEIRGLGVDFKRVGWCDYADRMREFGIEVD